jgi:hypothetical protein
VEDKKSSECNRRKNAASRIATAREDISWRVCLSISNRIFYARMISQIGRFALEKLWDGSAAYSLAGDLRMVQTTTFGSCLVLCLLQVLRPTPFRLPSSCFLSWTLVSRLSGAGGLGVEIYLTLSIGSWAY